MVPMGRLGLTEERPWRYRRLRPPRGVALLPAYAENLGTGTSASGGPLPFRGDAGRQVSCSILRLSPYSSGGESKPSTRLAPARSANSKASSHRGALID